MDQRFLDDPFNFALDAFHYWDTGHLPPDPYPEGGIREIMLITQKLQLLRSAATSHGWSDEDARRRAQVQVLHQIAEKEYGQ